MKSQNVLFSSGDNSYGFLWNDKYSISPLFIRCMSLPVKNSDYVTQITAFNSSIGLLLNNSSVIYKHEADEVLIFSGDYAKIKCNDRYLYGLDKEGQIINIITNKALDNNRYECFSVSSRYVIGITRSREVVIVDDANSQDENGKVIAHNAITIGCNEDVIFISDEEKLMIYKDGELEVLSKNKFIQIECNEDNALFLDDNGVVWKYDLGKVMEIYGLPVIVQVSVGVQHFAVLSYDGRVYTWGFNPSGQLGAGNDLSTSEPSMVKNETIQVECSAQNTFILCSKNEYPKYPKKMKSKELLKIDEIDEDDVRNIIRSELLF